ncbi:MAG: helix-turn-helix domain-containing protein [Candidatus Nanopelagicaceae bacterium]
MTLLRTHIGSTLRQARISQGRTLRDVAKSARVSLGYLSEVERGQKEASSELLNAICQALDLSLLAVIADVSIALSATQAPSLTVVEAAA